MSETLDPTADVVDGDIVCRQSFDRITRRYLRQIVSDELIEAHRRNPSGRPSEPLGRLLAYFRRLPPEGQYLLAAVPGGGYRILRMASASRGRALPAGDEIFPTPDAGHHGIFLLKLKDMMDADNG
ncbi:hypothetical protein [Ensifer soli]|uniref:hypothetical protein n=1 Tax=Ciceribacter sp. sgz301302 TaxID=3342379 RepID=UPI0035B6D543